MTSTALHTPSSQTSRPNRVPPNRAAGRARLRRAYSPETRKNSGIRTGEQVAGESEADDDVVQHYQHDEDTFRGVDHPVR